MILKYKTTTKDTNEERWNYIDGIAEASTFVKDGTVCVEITKEDKSSFILAVYEEIFLLNDSGRTIEKIRV